MNEVLSREEPFGGHRERDPHRGLKLKAMDFQDVENANPIPLFYGTRRIQGITITPIFNLKTQGSGK